jgi:very-short-patch-repair endonuclease
LIAFSNDLFYKNRLNVFPSPHSINTELGIQTFYLKHGRYALQTNFAEGEQIVTLVRQHIESQPTYSLGIVTLNLKQRELVSELLEQELGLLPAFLTYKQQWEAHGDPFFVKNLENVQGDERDTIIISTTFGPDPETRKISQNFGPISRSNGWRRLNVLFTRAKRSIKLVTSLRPADLSITENTRDGTQALKKYLEYAQRANLITIDRSETAESHPLESHLVDLLRRNGYECRTQLGVAGFHIDIAVCHPHIPHTYIAALTADGHNYASAQTVRDRERIRQNVLTQIGWKDRIYRIWSPEWHQNPSDALKRLLKFLAPLQQKANLDHPIVNIEEDHTIDPPIALEHDATSSADPDDDMMAKIRRLLS